MKRSIFTMVIAATLALSCALSGCGGTEGTTASSTTSSHLTSATASSTTSPTATTTTTTTTTTTVTTTTQQTPPPVVIPPTQPTEPTEILLKLSSPVKVLGRSPRVGLPTIRPKGSSAPAAATYDAIAMDHSAAAIVFSGTFGGEVTLTGKGSLSDKSIFFTVFVDGVRNEKRLQVSGNEVVTLTLATDLDYDHHTIEFVRQSELRNGYFDAQSLSIYGVLDTEKPAEKDLYIEFVGDSITCGNGVLHTHLTPSDMTTVGAYGSGSCTINHLADSEGDATLSYAFLLARELGADYSFVSYSGIGLHRGWGAFGNMKNYYNYASYLRKGTQAFDFSSARKPDMVVINLGTNDNYFKTEFTQAQYEASVAAFINQIRQKWNDPDLPIVFATGMMGNALSDWAQNAITAMNDANIHQIRTLSASSGGDNGHPTVQGHQTAADELLVFLRNEGLID